MKKTIYYEFKVKKKLLKPYKKTKKRRSTITSWSGYSTSAPACIYTERHAYSKKNTPKRTWHIKHFRRNLFFNADVKAWLFDWLVAYWFLNIHICICYAYPGRDQFNNKSKSHDRFCQVNWLRWRVDNLISTRKWCLICIIILPCNSL